MGSNRTLWCNKKTLQFHAKEGSLPRCIFLIQIDLDILGGFGVVEGGVGGGGFGGVVGDRGFVFGVVHLRFFFSFFFFLDFKNRRSQIIFEMFKLRGGDIQTVVQFHQHFDLKGVEFLHRKSPNTSIKSILLEMVITILRPQGNTSHQEAVHRGNMKRICSILTKISTKINERNNPSRARSGAVLHDAFDIFPRGDKRDFGARERRGGSRGGFGEKVLDNDFESTGEVVHFEVVLFGRLVLRRHKDFKKKKVVGW